MFPSSPSLVKTHANNINRVCKSLNFRKEMPAPTVNGTYQIILSTRKLPHDEIAANIKIMALPGNISAYQRLMLKIASVLPVRFRAAFLHPAGPTTVFFWAPTFKWGLVIAGIGDLKRPADTISLSQTASLMVTGAIWSRYSLVIKPKNYNLFSVNIFTCCTGAYNFVRGLLYHMEEK